MAELNVANRTLFHGDNLDFLRGINSDTVHLIATDPPFNKNRDFHATPDSLASGAQFHDRWSWRDDIHDDWLITIQRDYLAVWRAIQSAKEIYGDDMGAFLCWLGVRLLEMHRILTDDGSLYLHIDDTAHAYVKALLDAIFGRQGFRGQVVWRRYGSHNDARNYGRVYDVLLYYAKDGKGIWNGAYTKLDPKYVKEAYQHSDDRGQYTTAPLHTGGLSGGGYRYTYQGHDRVWRFSEERMQELEADGRIHFPKRADGMPRRKVYLDEGKGQPLANLWDDIRALTGNHEERTGFPTQKPLALYERIIKASSKPNQIVLDPFCGCATTPVAAERLGRQWIGIDTWADAGKVIRKRMRAAGFDLGISARLPSGRRITITKKVPVRTDTGETAALHLRTPTGIRERHPPPRSQHGRLLVDVGPFCQGCGNSYAFDPRVLEVDHIRPKSDGGSDAYDNLTLLCPPCNKEKRDRMTLTGLQDSNRRNGYLLPENEGNIRHGRAAPGRRRRRR